MGSPEGRIIEQAYVILLKIDKNKEVLVSNDWGKIGKKTWRNFVGSKLLLNMTLSLRIRVGLGCFIHRSHHHGHSHHPHLGLMLPIHHVSVADMFKRSHSESSPWSTHHNTSILHPFMTAILNLISSDSFHLHKNHFLLSVSLMWDSLRPSYDGLLLVDISSLSKRSI